MGRTVPKYVIDTQLFIRAFRDPVANLALQEFHRARAPFEYLSALVAQELRAGILRPSDRRALERQVLGIYEQVGRLITPSANAWQRAGDVLAAMAREKGLELSRVFRSFSNRFTRFEFIAPWP